MTFRLRQRAVHGCPWLQYRFWSTADGPQRRATQRAGGSHRGIQQSESPGTALEVLDRRENSVVFDSTWLSTYGAETSPDKGHTVRAFLLDLHYLRIRKMHRTAGVNPTI